MSIVLDGSTGITIPADPTAALGLATKQYADSVGLSESFRGLTLRTSYDSSNANTQIVLVHADEIVVTDGTIAKRVTPTDLLTCNTGIIGAGGMEVTRANSTWNRIYFIRKSTDGTQALFASRAKDYFSDTSQVTNDSNGSLRLDAARTKLDQGFQLATAGKVEFIQASLFKTASPVGNYWFTIEADVSGNASGTALATSDKYDVSRLLTAATLVRLPFRTPATLSATTQYHLVLQADFAISGTNYMSWTYKTATNPYANGIAKQFDGSLWTGYAGILTSDFNFNVFVTRNDAAPVLPSGYDQKCQIGWFYINSGGTNNKFYQKDRRITASRVSNWKIGQLTNGVVTLTDLSTFIPPATVDVIMLGTDTGGTYYSSLGKLHATDLTVSVEVDGSSIAAHNFVGASAQPRAAWSTINLEYQAMMQICGSSSTHIWVGEFTW